MAGTPAQINRTNRFVVRRGGYLLLLPKRPSGEAFVKCRYELEVGKTVFPGVTDGEGRVKQAVPRRAKRAELRLWDADEPDSKPLVWPLILGPRPPVTQIEGVQWRLENLGFDCGDEYGNEGPQTRKAIRAFEEWVGLKSAMKELEQSGKIEQEASMTPKTRKALDQVYSRKAGLHHGAELVLDDAEDGPIQENENP